MKTFSQGLCVMGAGIVASISMLTTVSPLLAQFPFRTLALTGDHAPGTDSAVVFASGPGGLYRPAINNSGHVSFLGTLVGPNVNSSNSNGVWSDATGGFDIVLRGGMVESSPPNGVLSQFFVHAMSDNNDSSVLANYSNFDLGIVVAHPGQFSVSAREGSSAPGISGNVMLHQPGHRPGSAIVGGPSINASGNQAFYADVSGPQPLQFPGGLWTGRQGNLSLVAYLNQPAPGTAASFTSFGPTDNLGLEERPLFNDQNKVIFHARTTGNGTGIWTGGAGSLALVTMNSDPAPGTTGTFASFSLPRLNNNSDLAFAGTISGGGITSANDNGVWYRASNGIVEILAREGDSAPNFGGGVNLSGPTSLLALDGQGDAAVFSLLSGSGVDASNDWAIFQGKPGHLDLALGEGMQAPGMAPDVRFAENNPAITMNNAGLLVINSSLAGPGIGANNDRGYWGYDSGGSLFKILAEGDSLEVLPGDFRTIIALPDFATSGGQDGQARALNDAGEFVVHARFSDGTDGLLVMTVPEPSTIFPIAFLAIICCQLRSRR